jgi:6-pyruvoyl-tetrahydropterin synthase
MTYLIDLQKEFKAKQGLASPIRREKNLQSLQPSDGYSLILKAGIKFDESQLGPRGWFVDTDSLDEAIENICAKLSSDKWTSLFDFRPTFELVAKWAFEQLQPQIKQLEYIEINNQTLKTKTRYSRG